MGSHGYNSPSYSSVQAKPEKPSLTEALLVGCIGLCSTLGSFGSGSLSPKRIPCAYQSSPFQVSPACESVASVSVSEQIQHIQNNLRLNMSALAELIDVSRPSLYKWLKGEPPHSQEVLNKISWLHNQASRIETLNLVRADILIKRPVFNGQSLFDFLKVGTVVEDDYLLTLQNIDQKEANVRASSVKGKPIRSIQDAIDEISTPIMRT